MRVFLFSVLGCCFCVRSLWDRGEVDWGGTSSSVIGGSQQIEHSVDLTIEIWSSWGCGRRRISVSYYREVAEGVGSGRGRLVFIAMTLCVWRWVCTALGRMFCNCFCCLQHLMFSSYVFLIFIS